MAEVKLSEMQRRGLTVLSERGNVTVRELLPDNPRGTGMVAKSLIDRDLAEWRWEGGLILPMLEITPAGRAALKELGDG